MQLEDELRCITVSSALENARENFSIMDSGDFDAEVKAAVA